MIERCWWVGVLLGVLGCAPPATETPEPPRPKLVVVLSVDQMRADFLTRFAPLYRSGLSRLAREGAVFTDARIGYALTLTAPGHATMSTGTYPRRTGVVANWWWDRAGRKQTYAVEDLSADVLDLPASDGCSPTLLRRETLGAWLKAASPESRVFSVALKNRSAILMGGHRPDGVYWLEVDGWRFATSSYYRPRYPDWVHDFNLSGRVRTKLSEPWELLLPEEAYALSREDDFAAESDGLHVTFPHLPDEGDRAIYAGRALTPSADELTFEFCRELIAHERLGEDDAPDLLWIGASAADEIGHRYGPMSREAQDYYLRLDRMLGEFLAFLDERLGPEGYALVLSADHGAPPLPESVEGDRAGRIDLESMREIVTAATARAGASLDLPGPLEAINIYGVILDPRGTSKLPEDALSRLRAEVARQLRQEPFVADVFTHDELGRPDTADRPFLEAYRRSFDPERSPDLLLRFRENFVLTRSGRGTTHGSPYAYDTRVPLVLFGPGIPASTREEPAGLVDIAPTVAAILGIPTPDDLDGKSLLGGRP